MTDLKCRLRKLKYFVVGVDGTLTDSGICFDDKSREMKRFSSRDFVGCMAAHYIGIKSIVVTGRKSILPERRMKEMKVDFIYQGIKDKRKIISEFFR